MQCDRYTLIPPPSWEAIYDYRRFPQLQMYTSRFNVIMYSFGRAPKKECLHLGYVSQIDLGSFKVTIMGRFRI